MTELMVRAMPLASELHRDHVRKGTSVPYLSHLLAVSFLAERKPTALDALSSHSGDALLIIAADKLHNARATLNDLELSGPRVWDRFKTGQDGFLWYHEEMAGQLNSLLPGSRSVARLRTINAALSSAHPMSC